MCIRDRYYGDAVREEVLSKLVEDSYREAIAREKVAPVSQPLIDGAKLEEGKGLSYSATVEVKPEVALQEYTGLRLTKRLYSVAEEDVAKALDELRERYAEVQPSSLVRPLQKGDYAVVDFQRLPPRDVRTHIKAGATKNLRVSPEKNEEVLEKKENILVHIGSGEFPFENGLMGMETGQEREVVVTESSLTTMGALYKVKVKEVKVKILPPLDDEFSKTIGYNNVQELKRAVQEKLEADSRRRTEREFRDKVFDALIEKNSVDAPPSMVEGQVDFLVSEMKRLLGPKAGQLEEGKLRTEFRPGAIRQVKASLILDAVSQKEGISVSEEEIEEEIRKIAKMRNERVEAVRERYRKQGLLEGLKVEMREDKAMKFVVEKSQVIEV